MPRYEQLFNSVDLPESERLFAQKAFQLLSSVHSEDSLEPHMYQYLQKTTDNAQAVQAFWERDIYDEHQYDRLALSVMPNHFVIGVEHRVFTSGNTGVRTSLSLNQGGVRAYRTIGGAMPDRGSTSPESVQLFKQDYFETIARLGLKTHIQSLNTIQNESVSANLASAA